MSSIMDNGWKRQTMTRREAVGADQVLTGRATGHIMVAEGSAVVVVACLIGDIAAIYEAVTVFREVVEHVWTR